jgi:hypothetical protein
MVACGIMRDVLERRLRRLADLSTTSEATTKRAGTRQTTAAGA